MEAGGIGALEPRDAPPELTGCPYCQRADEVRRVPMAVEAGAGLAPAAPPVRFGKLPLAMLVWSALAVAAAETAVRGPVGTRGVRLDFLGVGVTGALAVVNALGVVGIFRRRRRIRAGKPAALAVWNDGWYCGRCGLVYFQPGYEPKGVALRQALSPAQFQHEVYRAGGYQDLAGENEV
jgi:ribosomal protein S27AE